MIERLDFGVYSLKKKRGEGISRYLEIWDVRIFWSYRYLHQYDSSRLSRNKRLARKRLEINEKKIEKPRGAGGRRSGNKMYAQVDGAYNDRMRCRKGETPAKGARESERERKKRNKRVPYNTLARARALVAIFERRALCVQGGGGEEASLEICLSNFIRLGILYRTRYRGGVSYLSVSPSAFFSSPLSTFIVPSTSPHPTHVYILPHPRAIDSLLPP